MFGSLPRVSVLLASLLVAPASGCGATAGTCPGWLYAGQAGAASDLQVQLQTWPETCKLGRAQSPINIVTADVAPAEVLQRSETKLPALLASVVPFNSGHAFQINITTPPAQRVNFIRGKQYIFVQAHWHTPAENTIDGHQATMEMHLVHKKIDPKLGDTAPMAVIAILYELSDECNAGLDAFWEMFPVGTAPAGTIKETTVDLAHMLSPEMLEEGYYHWTGSLTTPPCTEGLDWNLMKRRLTVCQAQVDRLKQALASVQGGVSINNRAVQPLNERVVTDVSGLQARLLGWPSLFGLLEAVMAVALGVWAVALHRRSGNQAAPSSKDGDYMRFEEGLPFHVPPTPSTAEATS